MRGCDSSPDWFLSKEAYCKAMNYKCEQCLRYNPFTDDINDEMREADIFKRAYDKHAHTVRLK